MFRSLAVPELCQSMIAASAHDSGIGMKTAQKVAVQATEGDVPTETKEHAGIGLTVVREILNLLSGRIEFDSGDTGRGTIARVSFKTAVD